jgi:hypothetical protein
MNQLEKIVLSINYINEKRVKSKLFDLIENN